MPMVQAQRQANESEYVQRYSLRRHIADRHSGGYMHAAKQHPGRINTSAHVKQKSRNAKMSMSVHRTKLKNAAK
jgi:hypothetical protein